MTTWYLLSLIALFLMGSQRFLYKVSAERGCNTAWVTLIFMASVTVLSTIAFFLSEETVPDPTVLILVAFVNGGAFLAGTVAHIEALKHVPATVTYPLIRLNIVLVILFSVLYFGDHLSFFQVIGIVFALLVVVALATEAEDRHPSSVNPRWGSLLIFIALFSGALASISSKFAALYTTKFGFMALSYLLGTAGALLLKAKSRAPLDDRKRDGVIIGLVMGITNFAGFYALLQALARGPLSVIAPITGMHFAIAIIFSVLIYKERLTGARIAGVAFTILSIIFLGM